MLTPYRRLGAVYKMIYALILVMHVGCCLATKYLHSLPSVSYILTEHAVLVLQAHAVLSGDENINYRAQDQGCVLMYYMPVSVSIHREQELRR